MKIIKAITKTIKKLFSKKKEVVRTRTTDIKMLRAMGRKHLMDNK